MSRMLRYLFALLMALILVCTWFIPAQAHAVLVYSIPGARSALSKSPTQVELYFSEGIALKLSQIKVMDEAGKQVDLGDKHLDPTYFTHLVVTVPELRPGLYQVVWKVVSSTDGHQTSGAFPFVVGDASTALMVPTTAQTGASLPIADMLVKGILYLVSSVLLGALIFTFLAWYPSIRQSGVPPEDVRAYERFSKWLTLTSLIVLTLANLLSLMVQSGLARGTFIAWPWQTEFRLIVATTHVGTMGILRFEAAIVLAFLLLRPRNLWNRWAALLVCLLLLLTFSLQSHAAGSPRPFLPVLADWLHLTAVSVWVGGLFSFLGGMILIRRLAPGPRTVLASVLIPHFNILALASVVVLGMTGLYSSFLHVSRLNALWSTTYGQALVIKLLIAVPMLAMGGFHLLVTTPLLRRAASQPGGSPVMVNRFHSLLVTESVLGVAILLWVGALTSLPPANLGIS